MTVYYVALAISILAGIGGQVLLKLGADAPNFISQVLRPSTLAGLALYGSAAFLYMVALRKIPISVAFPTVSLSYAIVALIARFHSNESFQIPAVIEPRTYAAAAVVVLAAAAGSAFIVRRQINRLDLVAVLKTRD